MSEKLITLSGAEVKVTFSGGNAWLRNDGAAVVYASKTAGVTAGADGVVSIPAGGSAPVYGAGGTVFLLGSGSVQLIGSDYATNPFVGDSFGGGAGISTNAAGIVTLDGLQGGVPFSGITLSGDIVGQEVTVRVCGKNLFELTQGTITKNGITFTNNGDGSFNVSGTATVSFGYVLGEIDTNFVKNHAIYFSLRNAEFDIKGFNLTLKIQKNGGDVVYYAPDCMIDFDGNPDYVRVVLWFEAGVAMDYADCKVQIELGNTATEYEPYSGSTIAITPDSVPYTVPNDIRQQEGINNVSVSAGEVTVTGVRHNAALGKIWAKLDELTAALIVANGEI